MIVRKYYKYLTAMKQRTIGFLWFMAVKYLADRVRRSQPQKLLLPLKKSQPSLKASAGEGGEGGIRTRDTLSGIYTFQAYLFNHSSTSPLKGLQKYALSAKMIRNPFTYINMYRILIIVEDYLSKTPIPWNLSLNWTSIDSRIKLLLILNKKF